MSNGPSRCSRLMISVKPESGAAVVASNRCVSLRRIVTVPEIGVHDGLGDGRRHAAAAFSVFHDQSNGDARLVKRRKGDKQCMIALAFLEIFFVLFLVLGN